MSRFEQMPMPAKQESKTELGWKKEQIKIPEEIKEWPPYLKQRFEVIRVGYNLDFPKLSEMFQKHPSLASPELLFLLSYRYEQLKEEGKQLPVVDKTLLQSLAKELPTKEFIPEAAEALGKLGKPGLETLKDLAQDEEKRVRIQAAEALGNLGEPGLETLKDLAQDEDEWVRGQAAEALGILKLHKLHKALEKINKQDLVHSLTFRQEPLFANPVFGKEMEQQLLSLSDIVKDLKQKYPEFIGLSVLGSFSKGYYLPGSSDLDWGLIYHPADNTQEMVQEFKERAKQAGFRPCQEHLIDLSKIKTREPDNLEVAFNGLFIGNRKELTRAQNTIIEQVDEEKWKQIQRAWESTLKNYSKAMQRFNLTREEFLFVKHIRNYLWQLPDYNTMRSRQ